ncbi:MAG: IS1634 family transposase [Anaerolineae bacterium]
MAEQWYDVEFEPRTIGPLVLTTPVLQGLGLRGIVNGLCPIAEQGNIDHGTMAEVVTQCRLSDPRALYDMVDWAEKHDIPALYPEIEEAKQLNDDRVGRMLDAIYEHRPLIWGELMANAASRYEIDLSRLHADTMPIKFAGLFADQPDDESVPRLEEGYNPQGEWVKQLKLFALAAGDGGLPVWFDALNGGDGDSPAYVPQFEAFCQHANLASFLPLEEVIMIGDRKMPTQENQLIWLRAGIGYIGPVTMQEADRQTLRRLLDAGREWEKSAYVAQRDQNKPSEKRTVYHYLGHSVTLTDEETGQAYDVRHLYVHSSALAAREATRRQDEMVAIEAEIRRIQGLVNKYDYKTAEITAQRVQKKAFKKRRAQRYFTIEVVEHADRPEAPLELTYQINWQQVQRDAELDGVYLLVAGGPAAQLDDAQIFKEWKGQYKVEHRFRMLNAIFFVGPIFLKKPQRIVSLIFLIMVGSLVAGLIERQVRRVLAELQEPIRGLMPEGRDNLRPTVERIFKAFAHYGLVRVKGSDGTLLGRQFAKPDKVQQQILDVLGFPQPAEIFGQPTVA